MHGAAPLADAGLDPARSAPTATRGWLAVVRAMIRELLGLDDPVALPAPEAPWLDALPALAPLPAASLPTRPAEHVRLCVDFGTSTSTVARAVRGAEPELAVLQADPRTGRRFRTVDSDVAWAAGEPAILGAAARLMEERGRGDREFHRSLKRMLSDVRRHENAHLMLRLRCEALIAELLRLALAPETSGTVRAQSELTGVPVADVAAPLGLPERASLLAPVARGTLDLYLCVPNAFGNFEEEVLRGAARSAGEAFQREAAALIGARLEEPAVVVHLVREADAVAWWVLHERHLRRPTGASGGTWLVFDVGAGSTDAAVVDVRAPSSPGEAPSVRAAFHSGASFGGNDVDELLLRLVAERAGEEIPAGVGRRVAQRGTTRAIALRQTQDAKEAWAADVENALAVAQPFELDRFLAWIERPDGPMPGQGALPPYRPPGDLWDVRDVATWGEDYARFLRGTVVGVLKALAAQRPDTRVDRVVLSGRGTLLPGVRRLVTRQLLKAGWIASADQVEAVAPGGEDLKLACVLGIAVAASHAAVPTELPQTLSDEVSLGRDVPLWSRGTRLYDATVRAGVRLAGSPGSRLVGFHQHRCPREVAEAIGAQNLWEHRHLGATELHLFEPVELAARFDTRTARLDVWRVAGDEAIPLPLEVDPVFATGTNPISRLPFGWVDGS